MEVQPKTQISYVRLRALNGGSHLKTHIKNLTQVFSVVAALAVGNSAFAQTQQFTVVVSDVLSISAPADVSINHDTTDANQSFNVADSNWAVLSNQGSGATVTFTSSGLFTNIVGSNIYTRDYTMGLSVVSDPDTVWSVTGAGAFASSSGVASGSVQAASTGPGNATLGLDVTFVDSDFSVLPAGNYTMAVTATIVAN